jgi:DNA-binding GntR family transcriptional regulator
MAGLTPMRRPETLSRRAYHALRKVIRDGKLEAGAFYSENQIAKLLNVSRTPVREALIELAREGIVEKVPQRGFLLRTVAELERQEAFALRDRLESFVVERLAIQASDKDISELRAILERQEGATTNITAFLDIDEEFHLAMPRLLGLERTRAMLLTLRGIIWLSGSLALRQLSRTDAVLREHIAVVDSIESGDVRSAARAISRHIRNSAEAAGLAKDDTLPIGAQ